MLSPLLLVPQQLETTQPVEHSAERRHSLEPSTEEAHLQAQPKQQAVSPVSPLRVPQAEQLQSLA